MDLAPGNGTRRSADAEERDAEVAQLAARVERLERQLAEMVKRFSGRLNEHQKRLDKLDVPIERKWFGAE
jgi:predicted nuclease with TOPRIM domain